MGGMSRSHDPLSFENSLNCSIRGRYWSKYNTAAFTRILFEDGRDIVPWRRNYAEFAPSRLLLEEDMQEERDIS